MGYKVRPLTQHFNLILWVPGFKSYISPLKKIGKKVQSVFEYFGSSAITSSSRDNNILALFPGGLIEQKVIFNFIIQALYAI